MASNDDTRTDAQEENTKELEEAFFITDDFDVDEDIDFDIETLKIIDDSVTTSAELIIHHDVSEQLKKAGFEDLPVHLEFIPDIAPAKIESSSITPNIQKKDSTTKNKMCPSCGRSYSKSAYLDKHLKICRRGSKGKFAFL